MIDHQIKITKASLDDVEPIRRMQAQSWCDTYENPEIGVTAKWLRERTASWFTPEKLAESYEHLGKVFANPQQFYRVAKRDGEVVGFVHFSTHNDDSKELAGMYLDKSVHGTGLAQRLVAEARDFLGDKKVDLWVAEYNTRAIKFYEKCGFRIVPGERKISSDKIPSVRMERSASNGYQK